jgi:gas vesicle protein
MYKLGQLIFGAILGGLIGSGLGLLLAPKPGKATREDISAYTNHVKDEVKQAAEHRRVELKEELDRMRIPIPNE